jgi:cytochrome oxidase Cu insertion factor (SCO1/SenC/PrrC family)
MTIRTGFAILIILAAAVYTAAQSAPTQTAPQKPTTPPPAPHTNLKVGDPAPDFTLPSTIVQDGKRVRYTLSDFKGKKNVVLAFYVFAFTGG